MQKLLAQYLIHDYNECKPKEKRTLPFCINEKVSKLFVYSTCIFKFLYTVFIKHKIYHKVKLHLQINHNFYAFNTGVCFIIIALVALTERVYFQDSQNSEFYLQHYFVTLRQPDKPQLLYLPPLCNILFIFTS